MTTITKRSRQFSDLDLLFTAHPLSGDVVRTFDENAVKKSLINLIMMKPYDVPFHPEISCQANNLLFELSTAITPELIRRSIFDVISKFEPRVQINDVDVEDDSDANAYRITIDFTVIGSDLPYTVSTLLTRTR